MAIRYTASDLHEQAVISSLTVSTDSDFQETVELVTVTTVRGKFVPQPGRETMRAEQITQEPRAMFVIRYRDWLTENHVITIRSTVYEIHSIVDVEGRRRFQELVISERVAPLLITGE